jgi:hypothetical protein
MERIQKFDTLTKKYNVMLKLLEKKELNLNDLKKKHDFE